MQGVRRVEHLPAQSAKEQVQGVRRGEHLPAQSNKEHVQGVRRGEHLPAHPDKEPMQDVRSRQGRVHAARSQGAVDSTHIGFCPDSGAFRSPGRFSRVYISLRRRYRIIGTIADRCAPTCSLVDAPVALSDTAASSCHDRHLSATLSFAPDSLMGNVFDP